MSYFDLSFAFLFIPIVVLIFMLVPKKVKTYVLLLSSYLFFFMISGNLVIFLLLSTISIYLAGKKIGKINSKRDAELLNKNEDKKIIKERYKKKKKLVLTITILFNLSFLFYFKYLNFFGTNLSSLLDLFGIETNFKVLKLLSPIGISYYTLMAISYIVDVYNEKIQPDNNITRLALYLSFFPQIMEGPISKYSETADQLYNTKKVTFHNFCFGYQRILYGFFKKFVIADRLNSIVKVVFNNYTTFGGVSIFIGIVSYTVLLYMEFSGTMDVVIGTGEIFGVKIPENFRQPFFSKNITEFWSRWHISLGHWLKDYVFYPVSLSKPLKKITNNLRKKMGAHYGSLISGAMALFCVWFLNGLWHGAGYPFLLFGMYHFFLIVMGSIFEPIIQKICTKLKINRISKPYMSLQIIKTSFLVFIGEMFFRAETVGQGFGMLIRMFKKIFVLGPNEFSRFGIDYKDFLILIISLITILIISILKEKNINIREKVESKHITIRWLIYYILIFSIIIFGAYGPSYSPVDPIYADF